MEQPASPASSVYVSPDTSCLTDPGYESFSDCMTEGEPDTQFTASNSWAVLSAPPPAPLPGSVLSIALQELSLALTDDLCFKALYHEILRLSLTDITAEVRPRSSCTV